VPWIELRWGINELRMIKHMTARITQVIEAAGGLAERLEDLFRFPLLELMEDYLNLDKISYSTL